MKLVDSELPWAPRLPAHWIVKKLGFVAALQSGESITSDDIRDSGAYPVYGGNGLRGYTDSHTHSGDYVLIGRQGALCGNINYATGKFWASEHAIVVTPREKLSTHWLGELLRAMDLNQHSVSAAQPGLAVETIANLRIPVPPLEEQRAIADFLDRETARLDALVAAKERLLELLAEKRRALITRAVTRGLDPAAPLRDSGLAWLGHIPMHWEARPLRYLCEFRGGATPDKENAEYWNGVIPWVSAKDMKRDEIADAEDHVSADALSETSLRLIPADAVLVVVRGMILAHSFPTAITLKPVTINQDMKALVCGQAILPPFLKRFFEGVTEFVISLAEESAHGTRKLETDVLRNIAVPVPPLPEQRSIVAHIAAETPKLDALRAAAERSITLLRERRAALIAAAVTGRLQVV